MAKFSITLKNGKSYESDHADEIYTFWRSGGAFAVPRKHSRKKFRKIQNSEAEGTPAPTESDSTISVDTDPTG